MLNYLAKVEPLGNDRLRVETCILPQSSLFPLGNIKGILRLFRNLDKGGTFAIFLWNTLIETLMSYYD